jgi:cytochrome P450
MNEMPDFFPDVAKWRFVRQMTTATLTPAKIKAMSSSMKECFEDYADDMKKNLKEAGTTSINIDIRQSIFTMLTDMITRCVFSIKIDNKNDFNNHFVQIVNRLVNGGSDDSNNVAPNFMLPVSLSFPFLKRFLPQIFNPKAGDDFVKVYREILENRKRSGRKEKDYTETVLSWMDKLDSPEYKKVNVHELTLMMQALVIFFAGQDQISTIITYVFYNASKNPEIEEKIFEELDSFLVRHKGEIEYEHLGELTYLSACIQESLRLVPFFIRLERVCTKDWEHESGLKIKKGMPVMVPIWAVNRHPEYFPDPEKFNPDRFLPENKAKLHPYAFTSFGLGPRNCIGMRFALDVLVFLGAHVYRDFTFKTSKDSKVNFLPGSLFLGYCDPLRMDIMKRDSRMQNRNA